MSAQGLPAHILALFTPRPPPQHLPAPAKKKDIRRDGLAEYVEYFSADAPPPVDDWESPKERKDRRHREKLKAHQDKLKKLIAEYKPHEDANAGETDPFRTLFVARLSYDTTEKKLKREFEVFGSIKKVRIIYDLKGKPRGYAFIHFDHERDLKNAYKQGDGKKIDGRRVMVDVERSRTVEGWLPRRLGGGRGPGRAGKPSKKQQRRLEAQGKADRAKERDAKDKERDAKKDDRGDRRGGDRGGRDGGRDDRKRGGDDRKRDDDRKRGGGDERKRDEDGGDKKDRKRDRSRSRDRKRKRDD